MRMKINQEPSGRYVPPRSKIVMICTCTHILQVSNQVGLNGYYWSSAPNGNGLAYYLNFDSGYVFPASVNDRYRACPVRLVTEVK